MQQQRRCGHDFFRFPTEPVTFSIWDRCGCVAWEFMTASMTKDTCLRLGTILQKKDLNAGSSYLQTYFKENRGNFPFKCQAPVKSTFCYRFYFNFPTDYAWATVYSDGCWTKQKPNCVLVSGSDAVEWDIWCHKSQIPGKPFPWYIIKVQ